MPENNDDTSLDNMSIDEVNELFKNTIELPDGWRMSAVVNGGGVCSDFSVFEKL